MPEMKIISQNRRHYITSKEDMCKNCAKCSKGFKIHRNQAYNIKIKIRVGTF